MIGALFGGMAAMIVALFGTPLLLRFLVRKEFGQFIRDDGPTSHNVKRGTPTMGGIIIVLASVIGYLAAHIGTWSAPTASGLLVLFLMAGLGAVGFADDAIKITRKRSLGLTSAQKLIGQSLVASVFAVLALQFPSKSDNGAPGLTPASYAISFVRDTPITLAIGGTVVSIVLFIIWANVLIAGTSNGVNLTDGLDGLATGASALVFAAYMMIAFFQFNQNCQTGSAPGCYEVRDPLDLAVIAATLAGATFGFLWWNAAPAQIFMGDTGSLALGGALAGLAIMTRTEFLLVILAGLFVIETLSVILQVGSYKLRRKRILRMAPLHHHFELLGWKEITVVIRFWIIAGVLVALGLGIFYADWVVRQ